MKNPKILVTGGPVQANLDAVKIITNRFKGGRMLAISKELAHLGANVTYLCSKDARHDYDCWKSTVEGGGEWLAMYHSGFDHYLDRVLGLAHEFDCVVLGAAVANLIPDEEWKRTTLKGGKFPSHDYEEGDPVPILFRIAPRIINRVKEVAPKTKLVGFKLLSDVDPDVLIDAAKTVIRDSRANLVIANDAKCLDAPYGVTPEGGSFAIPNSIGGIAKTVYDLACDDFYSSQDFPEFSGDGSEKYKGASEFFDVLCNKFRVELESGKQKNGMIFGCVATRTNVDGRFMISSRGKKSIRERTVASVYEREVFVLGDNKASLNAPLIDKIFKDNPDVEGIVHWHLNVCDSKNEWAPPGTVRDSSRTLLSDSVPYRGFLVAGHGVYRFFTKKEIEEFRSQVGGC